MKLDFEKGNGLIPAIIQEIETDEVLMLGFMNGEAFEKTKATQNVWFFSRTKNRLWMKGEESGNKLEVREIFVDCDTDTILVKVELLGDAVCHTGNKTCFFTKL